MLRGGLTLGDLPQVIIGCSSGVVIILEVSRVGSDTHGIPVDIIVFSGRLTEDVSKLLGKNITGVRSESIRSGIVVFVKVVSQVDLLSVSVGDITSLVVDVVDQSIGLSLELI